jgi:very-short-patch-repair endonuclease
LEDLLLGLWRAAGLPQVRVNDQVWTGERLEEVDLHCLELDLVVEVDGARYHASRWRRRRDAEKDVRLRAVGKTVWRVPELEVTFNPDAVTAELHRLATLGLSNPRNTHVR